VSRGDHAFIESCTRCGGTGEHIGRQLCRSCWDWARRNGRLLDYPKAVRSAAEVVDEYLLLSARYPYEKHAELAARIGMSRTALSRALCRARRAGLLSVARDGVGGWRRVSA
jgi:hypothetical protein